MYSIDSLDGLVEHLEAKAFTLSGLPPYQLNHRKKCMNSLKRRRVCSVDQAGRKFIVYRAENGSQYRSEQKEHPLLNEQDERSPLAIQNCKDAENEPAIVRPQKSFAAVLVAAIHEQESESKERQCKAVDKSQADGVETGCQKALRSEQSPREVAVIEATMSSQKNTTANKKKRKNRGLKKTKAPKFNTCGELVEYLAVLESKLGQKRRRLMALNFEIDVAQDFHNKDPRNDSTMIRPNIVSQDVVTREKRLRRGVKTLKLMRKQYNTLSSRHARAIQEWYYRAKSNSATWDDIYLFLKTPFLERLIPLLQREEAGDSTDPEQP